MRVSGDTTALRPPTLAGTINRWRLVARNTGGRRLREVTLTVPHAEYVCIQRPQQSVRCGPPATTRDLGTFDPGDTATVDAWTSSMYRPALALPGDEPRLTYGEGDSGGIAVLDVLIPYSRTTVERLRTATDSGRFVVTIVAASFGLMVIGNWLIARVAKLRA